MVCVKNKPVELKTLQKCLTGIKLMFKFLVGLTYSVKLYCNDVCAGLCCIMKMNMVSTSTFINDYCYHVYICKQTSEPSSFLL